MKILVIHGPNLNLLGEREPQIYGHTTLDQLDEQIRQYARNNSVEVECFQSNHEGFIIDFIHDHRREADAILINPGALTHYSYALRAAIKGVDLPCVEVHLSDIHSRESFRKTSVIQDQCLTQISGHGIKSYFMGFDFLVEHKIKSK